MNVKAQQQHGRDTRRARIEVTAADVRRDVDCAQAASVITHTVLHRRLRATFASQHYAQGVPLMI